MDILSKDKSRISNPITLKTQDGAYFYINKQYYALENNDDE
jgi:hypothetical protein